MTTLRQLRTAAQRAEAHLLQDALGVAALTVMLIVGLYLPQLF